MNEINILSYVIVVLSRFQAFVFKVTGSTNQFIGDNFTNCSPSLTTFFNRQGRLVLTLYNTVIFGLVILSICLVQKPYRIRVLNTLQFNCTIKYRSPSFQRIVNHRHNSMSHELLCSSKI